MAGLWADCVLRGHSPTLTGPRAALKGSAVL